MTTLLQKYKKYTNGKEIINNVYKYVNNVYGYKQFKSINLVGGSIDDINQILKQFTDINISIDLAESTDEEIRIIVLTTDNKLICASFENINSFVANVYDGYYYEQALIASVVLNYETRTCEIIDLRSNSDCIRSSEKFIPKIIEIIKGIAKSTDMGKIELSDNSNHTCINSTNNFRLDLGNTLSNGYPYYYKYEFKFKNNIFHDRVKYNYNILKNIKTKDININDINDIILSEIEDLNYDNNKIIKKIEQIYNKYYEKNIKLFMRSMKYKLCEIFSLTYENLFRYLGLKNYGNNKVMIYKIVD
jgi:hypothetical protein